MLQFGQIVQSFLSFLNTESSAGLSKELHITGLKILRKIVEVENKELKTPAAEWDNEDWENYKQQIKAK